MATPLIYMNVYDRPAEVERSGGAPHSWGRNHGRYLAYNYKHKIKAMGGFDVASLELKLSKSEAEQFLLNRVGSVVKFTADNPSEMIWEGLINRIEITTGNLTIAISLDETMNDFRCLIHDTTISPNQQGISNSTYDNLESRYKYGWIIGSYDFGINYNSGISTATGIIRVLSENYAHPLISAQSGGGANFSIKVNCLGFYHTLKYDSYELAGATIYPVSTVIGLSLFPSFGNVASANGTNIWTPWSWGLFFNDIDTSEWNVNTTVLSSGLRRGGQSAWDQIQKLAETGSNGERWLVGIDPYDPNKGYRVAYYRPASTQYAYVTNAYYDPNIYTPQGNLVRAWDVRPDKWLRIRDLLPGWAGTGADPRYAYINEVSYDANQDQVVWQTLDNRSTNLSSALGTDKLVKRMGVNFGGTPRSIQY